MPGKKHEWVPESLVREIEKEMKETNAKTRIEAMESIARKLDEIVIKKRRFKRR